MKNAQEWFQELFANRTLVSGILTLPRKTPNACFRKVEIKPVAIKGETRFQFGYFTRNKVTHRNLVPLDALAEATALLQNSFLQCEMKTHDLRIHFHTDKSGSFVVESSPVAIATPIDLSHDRQKRRILQEGEPIDFLVKLGVMTRDGAVVASRYDKFKQVNRFLETVSDVAKSLRPEGTLNIIDFGSGKSYLTFALYYYFKSLCCCDVSITGLDLKSDVIEHCNAIARELNYSGLEFAVGDIAGFQQAGHVDMVVSLHACDTATDDAISKAVSWGSRAILAVPCCQHQLFSQIKSDVNRPLLKHGILKERVAALITDALRAEWLETQGYNVQVMEFIETEHTPKNLLIRAVRRENTGTARKSTADYTAFRDFWKAKPRIEELGFGLSNPKLTGPESISPPIEGLA